MRANLLRAATFLLLATLLAGGCRKAADEGPVREGVGAIRAILLSSTAEALGADAEELETRAVGALAATGRFEWIPPKGKDPAPQHWSATVEVLFARVLPARTPGGTSTADVATRITLSREGGERLQAEGRGQQELSFQGGAAQDLLRALDAALASAAGHLDAELRALSQTEEELIPDLSSDNPDRQDIAIRILAERRSVAAIPGLVALLSGEDRERQLKAVGALVAIGDPGAAPALIDSTSLRDPAYVIQITYALAELGGDDAEAFLFTVSNGHQDAAVRQAASEALRSLKSKEAAAQALLPDPPTPGGDAAENH